MKRFIRMEDNEDGTCTMQMYLGEMTKDEELSVVFNMAFDLLMEMMGAMSLAQEYQDVLMQNPNIVTEIPNSPESIE